MQAKKLGDYGEQRAVAFLIRKGYQIIERNWTFGHKEIDIIVQNDECLAFIEVRTRDINSIIPPLETVNKKKQAMISMAAEAYIEQNNIESEIRFDIISIIVMDTEHSKIEHIENAFSPFE